MVETAHCCTVYCSVLRSDEDCSTLHADAKVAVACSFAVRDAEDCSTLHCGSKLTDSQQLPTT